ncbi:MAG: GDP-mannose 4,6-dehydratase [Chloroflexota bacterium]
MITGIGGQDGFYLAHQLLAEGQRVLAAEDPSRPLEGRLDPSLVGRVVRVRWDAGDPAAMTALLRNEQPDDLYNLAACSSGRGMHDDPVAMAELTAGAVARTLEAIVAAGGTTRFCQASSSEMFGLADASPQTERTAFRPRSPYGAAKLFAHVLVDTYRERHGVFACSAILYNHESPRRRAEFVTRKVSHGAAAIGAGRAGALRLGNLDARRDWGYAPDYTRAMHLMLAHDGPGDYVVATGESHSVRELCELAFERVGLDYREHLRVDATESRSPEAVPLVGDATRLRDMLDWRPSVDFATLVAMMVDADVAAIHEGSS